MRGRRQQRRRARPRCRRGTRGARCGSGRWSVPATRGLQLRHSHARGARARGVSERPSHRVVQTQRFELAVQALRVRPQLRGGRQQLLLRRRYAAGSAIHRRRRRHAARRGMQHSRAVADRPAATTAVRGGAAPATATRPARAHGGALRRVANEAVEVLAHKGRPERGRGAGARRRRRREQPAHEPAQPGADVAAERRVHAPAHLVRQRGQRRRLERRPPCEQLVQEAAQRPTVALPVVALAGQDLRCHRERRADLCARKRRRAALRQRLGDAEIAENHAPAREQERILRLDVAVQDVRRVAVLDREQQLHKPAHGNLLADGPAQGPVVGDAPRQVAALGVLHHDRQVALRRQERLLE